MSKIEKVLDEKQKAQVFWLVNADVLSILPVHIMDISPPDYIKYVVTSESISGTASEVKTINLRDSSYYIFADILEAKLFWQERLRERICERIRKLKASIISLLPVDQTFFPPDMLDAENFWDSIYRQFPENDDAVRLLLGAIGSYYPELTGVKRKQDAKGEEQKQEYVKEMI